jgi:hypothetical protein
MNEKKERRVEGVQGGEGSNLLQTRRKEGRAEGMLRGAYIINEKKEGKG